MILYWKHLSLFSIVTLKGSWYMAFGDKFFPTSSSSIFGDLRTFKTKCSRAIDRLLGYVCRYLAAE